MAIKLDKFNFTEEVLEADGASRAFMQESISSVITLKAYSAENKTTQKAGVLGKIYYQKRMRRNVLRTTMNGVFSLLTNCTDSFFMLS